MGGPSSQIIASWVAESIEDTNWHLLQTFSSKILKSRLRGWSDSQISDHLQECLPYVAEHLRTIVAEAKFHGEIHTFEIDDEISPYIKSIKPEISIYLKKLQNMNPADFEIFCKNILEKLGCESSVTPMLNDMGIDFYAFNLSFLPNDYIIPIYTNAVVIGQAKRYRNSNHVREKEIREFIGSASQKLHAFKKKGKSLHLLL